MESHYQMYTKDEYHVYYDTSADNFTSPKDAIQVSDMPKTKTSADNFTAPKNAIQVFDVPKTKTYLNLYSRCF